MLSFSMSCRRRWLLLVLGLLPAFHAAAHQTPLPADAPAAPLDGAALGGGSTPAAGDPSWALNAVEPDASALVQQPMVVAMDLSSTGRGADTPPAPNRALLAPTPPRNWTRWIQIAAPPVVLVIGASLLVWFARSAGRRHRRNRHASRRRGSSGYRM